MKSLPLLLLLLCSCHALRHSTDEHHTPPTQQQLDDINYSSIVDQVYSYAGELRQTKGVALKSSRVVFDEQIKALHLDFESERIISLEQGRELLTDIVDGLLQRVNNDVSLHEALRGDPLTVDQLDLTVQFQSLYGYFLGSQDLGFIELRDGIVAYYSFGFYNRELDPYPCKYERYELTAQLAYLQRQQRIPYTGEESKNTPKTRIDERYVPNGK